jgi:hypothetical protein
MPHSPSERPTFADTATGEVRQQPTASLAILAGARPLTACQSWLNIGGDG